MRLKTNYYLMFWLAMMTYIFFVMAVPSLCTAEEVKDDKNGVSPNTIVLPSGPGSIDGLGESFKPKLNTGSAEYSVRINVPPGVNGHQPEIAIQYDSGLGDSPVGIGWTFGPGAISRQTDEGLPLYVDTANGVDDDHDGLIDEADELDTFIGPEKEELVPLADGFFRSEVEVSFAKYKRVGQHWEVALKNGTVLEYGLTESARMTDQSGTLVYKWLLEKSTDTNGNVIDYSYSTDPNSTNQKYLHQIRYGPGSGPWSVFYFLSFSYEDRPDWRKDYRSEFLVKTTRRLKQIDVGIQGLTPDGCLSGDFNDDSVPDALIRWYSFDYDDSNPISSYLSRITQYGSDGKSTLPAMSFDYAVFEPNSIVSAADEIIDSVNTPYIVMDSDLAELIDINYDSLPDILITDIAGGGHKASLNLGLNGTGRIHWSNLQPVIGTDGFSTSLSLASDDVHLADMDGDGVSDLVYTSPWDEVSFHLNKSDFTWDSRQYMSTQDTSPPSPFVDIDSKTTDMDFDKRIDIVKSTTNGYSTWLNIELGHYSKEIRTAGAVHNSSVIQFSDTGVHLSDMNGDRLSDVVKITPTQVVYCASMGHGNFAASIVMPLPDKLLTSGQNGQVEKAVLKDINGDGLSDLVIERAEINSLWYWLNLGTDTFSSVHIITDMPIIFNQNTATRWADMNGNGTADLVYADSAAGNKLCIIDIGQLVGGSGHPNLLTGINNGLGAETTIHYSPSADLYLEDKSQADDWQTTLPFSVQVVTEVTTEVATVSSSETYQQFYHYWSGYYDQAEKEFWGFARASAFEPGDSTTSSVKTTSYFHTGLMHESLKGKLKELWVSDENGKIFSIDKNTWQYRTLATGIDGREVNFAYNTGTTNEIYEGDSNPVTLYTRFEYDDYGNTISELKYGIIDPNIPASDPNHFSIGNDEMLITRQIIIDPNSWILDRQKSEQITDLDGILKSKSMFYYDDLPFGQVDRGNPTRQEDWLDTESCFIPTLRNGYDAWGNITHITNANNHARTLVYDSNLHTYPTQEMVHLDGDDLTLGVNYNYGLGTITDANDFTGVKTSFEYDTLGRLTVINAPQGARTEFDYDPNNPVSTISTRIHEDDQGNTFDSFSYYDGLGRQLGTKTEAEDGRWTFDKAVSFNQRTRVQKQWLPYFTTHPGYELPDPTDPNTPYISYQYDALDRVTKTTNPDGTYSKVIFTPLAEHLYDENDITDANTPKSLIYDGQERLVEVIERNADDPITPEYHTHYTWTTLGDLTTITDSHNNVKMLEYDSLRRKVFMNDPDRGQMHNDYDDVGNLIWTQDAKEQEIVYTYDFAERLKAENYLDTTGDPNTDPNDVIYYFDSPASSVDFGDNTSGTASYTKGRMAWVQDLSGQEHFSYDQRGNIDWSVKRILDPKAQVAVSYKSSFQYDRMDRLTDVVYPDNDHVHYEYNDASFTKRINGGPTGSQIISNIDYEPTGQRKQIDFGNGVNTAYTYDNRDRLNTLITAKSAAELISYIYKYDAVSNITRITDNRSFTSIPEGSARRNTQVFGYDDLYRLIQVRYASKDDPAANYGRIDYSYDAIGNMISKASPASAQPGHIDDDKHINLGTMNYSGGTSDRVGRDPGDLPGPHALTSTTNANGIYDYDDNGNMINIEGAECSWDFKDRLIRYKNVGTDAKYTYDYSGRRITKRVTEDSLTTQTLYPNRAFEIRPNQAPTKFVFNGDSRIARVKGTLDPTRDRVQRIWLNQGKNLICLAVETTQSSEEIFGPDAVVYEWSDPEYQLVDSGNTILPGQVLWVDVPTARIAVAKGTYNPQIPDINIPAGQTLTGWPRLEPFTPALHIEGTTQLNAYDPYSGNWRLSNPLIPAFLSDMPRLLPSATGFWCTNDSPVTLSAYASRDHDILFYHSDHLSSSNVVTNINGSLVQETVNYPFGHPRNDFTADLNNPFRADYKFTGKEKDKESGLMYYEARYYEPVTGRFMSVDPLGMIPGGLLLDNSHSLNLYAYALDNPLGYTDPAGLYPKGTREELLELSQSPQIEERVGSLYGAHKVARPGRTITIHEQETALAMKGGKLEQVATSAGCLAVTALFEGGGGAGVHLGMMEYDPSQHLEKGPIRTAAAAWEKFEKLIEKHTVSKILLVTDEFYGWKVKASYTEDYALKQTIGRPMPVGIGGTGKEMTKDWFAKKFNVEEKNVKTQITTEKVDTWELLNQQ